MPRIKRKYINLAFPANEPAGNKEIEKAILDAEKGPFYSSAQVKEALKKWRKKYSR